MIGILVLNVVLFTITEGLTWSQSPKLVGSGYSGQSNQGYSVALSYSGDILAIGGNTDANGMGAVWMFRQIDDMWNQEGSKLVGNDTTGAWQGLSVALSEAGDTLVVGGPGDNGSEGAVWVYTRTDTTWSQQGSKLISNTSGEAQLGYSVTVSNNGNLIAAGAPEDKLGFGAVWIYSRNESLWTRQIKIIPTDSLGGPLFGSAVAFSNLGDILAIGGVCDNAWVGATWVYIFNGTTWIEEAKLVSKDSNGGAQQGTSVSLNGAGNVLATGGQSDDGQVGATWVFIRTDSQWIQQGPKLVGTGSCFAQGQSVALSDAGDILTIAGGGGVWMFVRTDDVWNQAGSTLVGTLSASVGQQTPVALTGNANLLASGAFYDNGEIGATWVFRLDQNDKATNLLLIVALSCSGGLFIILFTIIIYWMYQKKKNKNNNQLLLNNDSEASKLGVRQ